MSSSSSCEVHDDEQPSIAHHPTKTTTTATSDATSRGTGGSRTTTTATTTTTTSTTAILICDAQLVQRLNKERLSTHFVGVRTPVGQEEMVRNPIKNGGGSSSTTATTTTASLSSCTVTDMTTTNNNDTPTTTNTTMTQPTKNITPTITYKVINPDGTERRMTSQEKRAARNKMMEEKKKRKELLKEQQQQQQQQRQTAERERKRQKTSMTPPSPPPPPPQQQQHQDGDDDDEKSENDQDDGGYSAQPSGQQQQQVGDKQYHQLSINQECIEEEWKENTCNDRRDGRAPALLSPSMAIVASTWLSSESATTPTGSGSSIPRRQTSNENGNDDIRHDIKEDNYTSTIQYDHSFSHNWAQFLKHSMRPAERVREVEDMRSMAYTLMPEAWTRLRSERNIIHPTLLKSIVDDRLDSFLPPQSHHLPQPPEQQQQHRKDDDEEEADDDDTQSKQASLSWIALPYRPTTIDNNSTTRSRHGNGGFWDVASTVVLDYLYQETDFHVSCGAKFGADFLLYDGPRNERHAFGGLRIVLLSQKNVQELRLDGEEDEQKSSQGQQVDSHGEEVQSKRICSSWKSPSTTGTMPSAYEFAGYVRCLNTAGKLALLATVVVNNDQDDPTQEGTIPPKTSYKVAFVDVALEKILTAPTHLRYGRSEKRRDVTKNLAKRPAPT